MAVKEDRLKELMEFVEKAEADKRILMEAVVDVIGLLTGPNGILGGLLRDRYEDVIDMLDEAIFTLMGIKVYLRNMTRGN